MRVPFFQILNSFRSPQHLLKPWKNIVRHEGQCLYRIYSSAAKLWHKLLTNSYRVLSMFFSLFSVVPYLVLLIPSTATLASCLWTLRIVLSLPGSRLTMISYCVASSATFTPRHPMVELYSLTFSRFPLRKSESKN